MLTTLACALCFNGLLRSAFPPALPWAVISVTWLLVLVYLRPRIDPAGLVVPPRWLAVVITVGLSWFILYAPGYGVYLLYLPFCSLITALHLFSHRRALSRPEPRIVARLLLAVVVALTVSAAIQYWRVARMSDVEKVAWVHGSIHAVRNEIARIARESPHPIETFSELLAATRGASVADAIARELVCADRDPECAALLVELLPRVGMAEDEVRRSLERVTGLQLSYHATADEWREALRSLQEEGVSLP